MYDTGTQVKDESNDGTAASEAASPLADFIRTTRNTMRVKFRLYMSASRLALGQSRWVMASAALGALSLGLVGLGVTALVSPYSGVETASLTADRAPRVVAWEKTEEEAPFKTAAATETHTDVNIPLAEHAAADTPPAETARTASSIANPGLFDPLTEEMLAAEAKLLPETPSETETRVTLASGETLMEVLQKAGVDRSDAYHAIAAMSSHFSPRKLRAGQEIALTLVDMPGGSAEEGESGTSAKHLTSLSMQPDIERTILVSRNEDGSFGSEELFRQFTDGYVRAAGTINNSFYLDAERAGIPRQIIAEMIRMYSYSVDFQREIQPGDKFDVYFGRKYDENNIAVKEGDVLHASLTVGGKTHKLWRFDPGNGEWDYFDQNGQSMKKFLMKTPIDGARLSSGFGMRKHPVLGYSKLHAGVDFAAPRGTPIYAAGDGTVTRANRFSSYGNYISIRHANGYVTAYAHLNGFARGIKAGTRVRQGQVIGYVGTTGRSTGPHLHYEVHLNGKKMNPLALKVPTGRKLEGKALAAFKDMRSTMETQMASAPSPTQVAQASATPTEQANTN